MTLARSKLFLSFFITCARALWLARASGVLVGIIHQADVVLVVVKVEARRGSRLRLSSSDCDGFSPSRSAAGAPRSLPQVSSDPSGSTNYCVDAAVKN